MYGVVVLVWSGRCIIGVCVCVHARVYVMTLFGLRVVGGCYMCGVCNV